MDRLALALETADTIFADAARAPTPRQRVQVMLLVYNHLVELAARVAAGDTEITSPVKNP